MSRSNTAPILSHGLPDSWHELPAGIFMPLRPRRQDDIQDIPKRGAMGTLLLLLCLAGGEATAGSPPSFPVRVLAAREFTRVGSARLLADVFIPARPGTYPGVLFIHGGGWCTGTRAEMSLHARRLAESGYVTATIDYRLAPKFKFPAQQEDCLAAWKWLREFGPKFGLDPMRMGVFGYSAGGQLACMLGMRTLPDDVPRPRVIVAGGAPCDFRSVPPDTNLLSYWLGGSRSEVPARYRDASPLAFVSADDPPTFFFGGERDWLVPRCTAERTSRYLRRLGVHSEFHVCPGVGHVATLMNTAAYDRACDFLDRHLQPPRPEPDVDPRGEEESSDVGP